MRRLFVAIDIPENIRDTLLDLQSGLQGARWRPYDNLHLTLRFIGEVDRHTEDEIDSALSQISAPAFEINLEGAGKFGNKRPRTLWTGVHSNTALLHLAQKVETAITQSGLQPEKRKFSPHVTLAYLNRIDEMDLNDFIAAQSDFKTPSFPIENFHLYQSHMGKSASHYEIIASYPLTSLDTSGQ
jgi:RNA 2',3'-cyclic 3'-phosphodiesterase